MEKKMKFNPMLRLKEMSLRKVVIHSWIVAQKRLDGTEFFWTINLEEVVKHNMSELGLPGELTKRTIDLVGPIGSELKKWVKFHSDFYSDNVYPDVTELCWTSLGSIDDRKTAKKIVHSNISVVTRYKFACYYCLEDDIHPLWFKLSKEVKAYYSGNYHQCSRDSNSILTMMFAWPHILSGEVSKENYFFKEDGRIFASFSQWAFEHSVKSGNKTATEYFFHKMTVDEKKDSLIRSTNALLTKFEIHSRCFDTLCYLLTLMTPEQQKVMVQRHPIAIVLLFLFYPTQDLYVENASFIWTYFPPNNYDLLLKKIIVEFQTLYSSCGKLFREFFIHSPPELRKCFANECLRFPDFFPARDFLSYFFNNADSDSIKVIFSNVEKADRLRLVFHRKMLRHFYDSISITRWSMVELCLQETELSKEDKMRWKEEFIYYVFRVCFARIKRRDPQWKGFFEFFDETPKEEKGQKRKLPELLDECSPK